MSHRKYSVGTQLLIDSMQRHGRRRLFVVTSSGAQASHLHQGVMDKLSYKIMRQYFGRTVYDDMEKLENLVSASDLDWTFVHHRG